MREFIEKITREAGAAVWKKFGKIDIKDIKVKKHAGDVVTEADLESTRILLDAIKKEFPNHGIISEEETEYQNGAEFTWIVDPLDGTRNFSTRTPLFGVMVALARNRELINGAIYMPATDEFYYAEKGGGAYLNGGRIQCSALADLYQSYGCLGNTVIPIYEAARNKANNAMWICDLGSAAVQACYTADGRRDWLVLDGGGLWDYAAPVIILRESGCRVTNFKGEEWDMSELRLVAANPELHKQLLAIVK